MKFKVTVVFLALLAALHGIATASAPPRAIAVLDAEKSWIKARAARDVKALQTLLSENYVHVDARGRLTYREGELASLKTMKATREARTEQTVDFAGDAAIVHGIRSYSEAGKIVRERYTDVYRGLNNRWQAISAQETTIR